MSEFAPENNAHVAEQPRRRSDRMVRGTMSGMIVNQQRETC